MDAEQLALEIGKKLRELPGYANVGGGGKPEEAGLRLRMIGGEVFKITIEKVFEVPKQA